MPLALLRSTLQSRKARQAITQGKPRVLKVLNPLIYRPDFRNSPQKALDSLASLTKNPIVAGLGNFLKGVGASLFGFVGGIGSSIWSFITGGAQKLFQFDWNATDQQLENVIKQRNVALASIWGGTIGRSLGWIAGIAVGYGVSFLCPVIGGASLAKTVAASTTREALQEVTGAIAGALTASFQVVGDNFATSLFLNYRKFLKSLPTPLLERIYGRENANFIKNTWGQRGGPVISFASKMDEAIQSIKSDKLRAFLEAFFEEAWDGFVESGYIVAQEIDNAYTQAKEAQKDAQGPERTVVLLPDQRIPEERIILQAPQSQLVQTVQNTLSNYRQIANRDIGQVVAQRLDDVATAKPMMRQLTIILKGKEKPPWRRNGKRVKEVQVVIPDAKQGLTWAQIKKAASSYTWGRFRATALLDNRRQIVVYANSEPSAQAKLREFVTLTSAEILSIHVSEEKLKKNFNLRKEPELIFPAYATLVIRRATFISGRPTLEGNYSTDRIRLDLWIDEAPENLPPLK